MSTIDSTALTNRLFYPNRTASAKTGAVQSSYQVGERLRHVALVKDEEKKDGYRDCIAL